MRMWGFSVALWTLGCAIVPAEPAPVTHAGGGETVEDLEELKKVLAEDGPDAVIERLQAHDDPRAAPILFSMLAQYSHFELKQVPVMIELAQTGIAYAQQRADAADPGSEEATYFLERVKAMSFNLAANTWPGWGDDVELGEAELAIGMEAARNHTATVDKLGLGPDKRGVSQWIVGAHELAAGNLEAARGHFTRARQLATEAKSEASVKLADGYLAIVDVLQGAPGARERLDAVIAHFAARDDEDSRIYGGQLRTALAAFE